MRVSPDGRQVAGDLLAPKGTFALDVWVADLKTGAMERLTNDSLSESPAWTRDGRAVAFSSSDRVRLQSWPRSGGSTPIAELARVEYMSPGPAGGYWAFSTANDYIFIARDDSLQAPRPFLAAMGVLENFPRVSPDGRLLAYVSDEGGQVNVYVQPIPGPGVRARISVAGGIDPIWSPDGTALFYLTLGDPRIFMRATIANRPNLEVTRRDSLFPDRYKGYDVMPNGREFLMLKPAERPLRGDVVTLIVNWPQLLARSRAVQPASAP